MKSKTENDSVDDLITNDTDHLTFFDFKTPQIPNDDIGNIP